MSKKAFNEFCAEYIPKHAELRLKTDKLNVKEFTKVALDEGRKAGFSFTKADIDAVLGQHRQVRREVTDLGGSVKASVNGTAMCYNGGLVTDDPADADWLVIKGTVKQQR
jgi:hypothetical protein